MLYRQLYMHIAKLKSIIISFTCVILTFPLFVHANTSKRDFRIFNTQASTSILIPVLAIASAVVTLSTARRAYLRLFSPAKINEFLKVSRPARPDGYHNLVSLFQAVSLGDTMRMSLAPEGREYDLLVCDDPAVPTDERNLVLQALDGFRAASKQNAFFNVEISKRIPMGAGLGGGSSNAATALYGANQLTGSRMNTGELSRVGSLVGSDVAFFLSSTGRALCEGRGDIVHDLKISGDKGDKLVLILLPSVHCATGPVFKEFTKTTTEYVSLNDLESAAFALHPELPAVKAFLQSQGVKQVTMSGSGSSFYGLCDPEKVGGLRQATREHFPSAQVHAVEKISKNEAWFDSITQA